MIHFQFTYFFKHSIWKCSEFCTDFSILRLDTFHDVQDGNTGWILQMVIFCYFFDCVQLELLTSPTSILLRNCLQTKDSIQFCAEERNDFVPTIFLTFCFFLRPMLTESERVEWRTVISFCVWKLLNWYYFLRWWHGAAIFLEENE
jgi:hypothetical protein